MRQKFWIILLIFLVGCQSQDSITIDNFEDKIKVKVEIVDEPEERMKGLMFRESLGKQEGMLFIFESEDYYPFWMKNTLIPLDMMWISDDKTIIDIQTAVPCEEDPCPSYYPVGDSRYVLEVNAGFSEENNIRVGNKIDLGTIN
ncbi:DUF192 domain-containing protein [Candidatus Woesearchaeota archaeon]|nr:DUF192 domain-containing protein [Candidatus Woesearchaeota archaeon]